MSYCKSVYFHVFLFLSDSVIGDTSSGKVCIYKCFVGISSPIMTLDACERQ